MRSFSEAVLGEVDGNDAVVDKLEIQIDLYHIRFTGSPDDQNNTAAIADDVAGFRERICRAPEQYRDEIDADSDSLEERGEPHCPRLSDSNFDREGGWVFNRCSPTRYFQSLNIAKSAWESQCPKPLFGGKMRLVQESSPSSRYGAVYTARLNLNLNLCRFLHYNTPTIRRLPNSRVGIHADLAERINSQGDEDSLDGTDNWVPRGHYRFLSWERVDFALNTYISRVSEAIKQELARAAWEGSISAAENSGFLTGVRDEQKYKLNYCEIAWEYLDDQPIRRVEDLLPILRMYARDSVEVNEYRVTEAGEGFSRGVIIRLGSGNQLSVYAKTNRRLRFELRYRMDRGCAPSPLGRKTAQDREGLVALVTNLKEHASQKMNDLFSFIRSRSEPMGLYQFSVLDLCLIILGHCGLDHEIARDILYQLSTCGSVPPARRIEASKYRVIRSMATTSPQVLEYDRRINAYAPLREFAWAVSRLGELGGWEHLVALPSNVGRSADHGEG